MNYKAFTKTDIQKALIRLYGSAAIHILAHGGSRSGKTFCAIRQIIIRALRASGSRHLIIRRVHKTVRLNVWKITIPEVLRMCFPGLIDKCKLNETDLTLVLPNGSEIRCGGLEDKERAEKILGGEYCTIFYNEASELSYDSIQIANTRLAQTCYYDDTGEPMINKAYYDCNPPTKSHWLYKLFFAGVDPDSNVALHNLSLYSHISMNPLDNIENLPAGYIDNVLSGLTERQKRRFRDGEWLDDVEGALWTRAMIDDHRYTRAPIELFRRIVVAIDPAVTAKEDSDLTGIIVAGEYQDGHYCVIDDLSLKGTPLEWGQVAVDAYHKYGADLMVAERNNGGDLVKANIYNVDNSVNVDTVWSYRGKYLRAEPISGLYEHTDLRPCKVHHVGDFPELEDQMCSFNPKTSEKSPDRLDALVFALTELTGESISVGVLFSG